MKDLKKVYQANTEEQVLNQLAIFKDKWGKQYPTAVHSWEENWDILRHTLIILVQSEKSCIQRMRLNRLIRHSER